MPANRRVRKLTLPILQGDSRLPHLEGTGAAVRLKDLLCFDPGEISKIFAKAKKAAQDNSSADGFVGVGAGKRKQKKQKKEKKEKAAEAKSHATKGSTPKLPHVKGATDGERKANPGEPRAMTAAEREEQEAVRSSLLGSLRMLASAYSQLRYVSEKKQETVRVLQEELAALNLIANKGMPIDPGTPVENIGVDSSLLMELQEMQWVFGILHGMNDAWIDNS